MYPHSEMRVDLDDDHIAFRKTLAVFVPYVNKLESGAMDDVHIQDDMVRDALRATGDYIDISAIQMWLSRCEQSHGTHCNTRFREGEPDYAGPSWLIDVHWNCIIPAESHHSYYALSYVWGVSPSSSLTTDNLQTMQTRDILVSQDTILPATIRDTLRLVGQLQGRYLWVDRLCIPQDDPVIRKRELDAMAMIYAGAYATIVAAQGGDADEGIHGIPGGTKPRGKSRSPTNSQSTRLENPRRRRFRRSATHLIRALWPHPDPRVQTLLKQSRELYNST